MGGGEAEVVILIKARGYQVVLGGGLRWFYGGDVVMFGGDLER